LRANGERRVGQDCFPQQSPIACCTLPHEIVFGDESAERRGLEGQPRTMLRRAIPSFTVEVRRRPRLATTSNPDVQSSETKPPQSAFDRASDRAAAFGANIDSSPVDVAPSHPRGRILPSLVPDEPRHRLLEYAPIPAKDSEPPSRERQSDRAKASDSSIQIAAQLELLG
jgi:hypothetical protein